VFDASYAGNPLVNAGSIGVLLAADMMGSIRTQTMRAFTSAEMEKILAKIK